MNASNRSVGQDNGLVVLGRASTSTGASLPCGSLLDGNRSQARPGVWIWLSELRDPTDYCYRPPPPPAR